MRQVSPIKMTLLLDSDEDIFLWKREGIEQMIYL